MNKCPCKVWSSDRKIKKSFMTFPILEDLIHQGMSFINWRRSFVVLSYITLCSVPLNRFCFINDRS